MAQISPADVVAAPAVSGLLAPTARIYHGFSLRETTGAATALVRVRDGSVTGLIMETIALNASESAREFYPAGLLAKSTNGIYIEVASGAIAGSFRVSN